ncbi:MAG TPA: hypothetical protein VK675_03010 [Candidatus Paceibacterota bacterium]|nr:hypothetical protein [Candidatus Paceibacterota bacterium]
MPELGPKNLSSLREIGKKLKEGGGLNVSQAEVLELLNSFNEEYIGMGREVITVDLQRSEGPEKIVAVNYRDMSPERAKEIFYLQRVFSTLFPHNFPHFYVSSGKNSKSTNENVSGTVRQKIKGPILVNLKKGIKPESTFYPLEKVKDACQKLGIQIKMDLIGNNNFILGADGGEYYVDTLDDFNVKQWSIVKIIKYMKNNNFTPADIRIVQMSIERLKTLGLK